MTRETQHRDQKSLRVRRRERIVLGLLAASDGLTAQELASRLELDATDDVHRAWMGRLADLGLIQSTGKTRGLRYFVAPTWLKGAGLDERTTLQRIEPHRLRALVVEDLERYPGASSSEVNRRVAPELAQRTVRRALEDLAGSGQVRFEGERRWRRYWLTDKGQVS